MTTMTPIAEIESGTEVENATLFAAIRDMAEKRRVQREAVDKEIAALTRAAEISKYGIDLAAEYRDAVRENRALRQIIAFLMENFTK